MLNKILLTILGAEQICKGTIADFKQSLLLTIAFERELLISL